MPNVKDAGGVSFVPAQLITGAAETVLLVPAAGVMGQFPSQVLPAGSGLSIGVPVAYPFDGFPFKIRLNGKYANPGGGTFTPKLYQLAAATVGVIGAAGSATSTGAPGTGDNAFAAPTGLALAPTPGSFWFELTCMWDSGSTKLNGNFLGQINNTNQALTAATQLTVAAISQSSATGPGAILTNLNFLPSFTFSVANAGNSVSIDEFAISSIV